MPPKIGISNNPEFREKTLQSEKPTNEMICNKRYVRPTTKILRGAGRTVSFVGKTVLRFPGTGLVAAGLYAGAKGIAKRQKGLKFPQYRQFNKRGRKII